MSALTDRYGGYSPIPAAGRRGQHDTNPLHPLQNTYTAQRSTPWHVENNMSKPTMRDLMQQTALAQPQTAAAQPQRRKLEQNASGNSRSISQPPPSVINGVESLRQPYMMWDEMVKDQAKAEQYNVQSQMTEEKLRKMRYKENLDKLAQQQKQIKQTERAEYLNSYPERSVEQMQEFQRALEQSQNVAKQVIKDSLDYNYTLHMEKKEKMRQEKTMGNVEMLKRFEEARKHEELSRTFEKERKNVFRNDLKNDMHRHSQDLRQQELRRQEMDREYNLKQAEVMQQRENEDKMFYDRIRQQATEKNQKGIEHLEAFNNVARARDLRQNSIIEQDQLERMRQEEEDYHSRLERQKKLAMENYVGNGRLMKDKALEDHLKRQENEAKQQELKQRLEESAKMDAMKRMNAHDQRKHYMGILDHQVEERANIKKHVNDLNRIEQQFLTRNDEKSYIAVPNGKNPHERQLQLNYIDKWLARNPELPTEEHLRLKNKDVSGHNRNPQGSFSRGY